MVYVLRGDNSYRALKKISEIRSAFYKKGGDGVAIVEIDGAESSYEDILERIIAGNLFAKKRLVICKRIIEHHPQFVEMMDTAGGNLFAPSDVFVFWEKDLPDKSKAYALFKKIATKIEETVLRAPSELDRWLQKEASVRGMTLSSSERSMLLDSAQAGGGEAAEWELEAELEKSMLSEKTDARARADDMPKHTPRPLATDDKRVFSFADKACRNDFSHSLIEHHRSQGAGVHDTELLRIIVWKLKNVFLVRRGEGGKLNPYVAQKAKYDASGFDEQGVFNAFWAGIMADSALKWDNKNAGDHLDRYLLFLKNKKKIIVSR